MNIVKFVFSYDRPLQLWGTVKSILDNSDLKPEHVQCLCKSSDRRYRRAYDTVGKELGCRIIHENSGYRWLDFLLPRASLYEHLLTVSTQAKYISLAVDDMMYFQGASFENAIAIMRSNKNICLWSWRIGCDLQPHDDLTIRDTYWTIPHRSATMPYRYIFHTDGSVFRSKDLKYWLSLLPAAQRDRMNLNQMEGYLAQHSECERGSLQIGKLHAGPLEQACVTWQINKVSSSGGAAFLKTSRTDPGDLLMRFEEGKRLDYSSLYRRIDWLKECNEGWDNAPTHIAPTKQAEELWYRL